MEPPNIGERHAMYDQGRLWVGDLRTAAYPPLRFIKYQRG